MTDALPDVSLVFETENEQEHRHIRLAESVEAWRNQTARGRILEWILVSAEQKNAGSVDLAHRMRDAGYRVVYDPRLHITHNYTDRLADLWGSVAMKGHAFACYAEFRGSRRRSAMIDAIGRYRVLLARLLELRPAMELPIWRLPVSAAFFLWYVIAAGYGYRLALRGRPVPVFRF